MSSIDSFKNFFTRTAPLLMSLTLAGSKVSAQISQDSVRGKVQDTLHTFENSASQEAILRQGQKDTVSFDTIRGENPLEFYQRQLGLYEKGTAEYLHIEKVLGYLRKRGALEIRVEPSK